MAEQFDPYLVWLGISPQEQPPNFYRLLGIPQFSDNPDVIENAADRQMAHLRTFQTGPQSDLSQKLLNEVSAARVCLLTPEKRAAYEQQLRQQMMPPSADTNAEANNTANIVVQADEKRSSRQSKRKTPKPGLYLGIMVSIVVVTIVVAMLVAREHGRALLAEQTTAVAEQPPSVQPTPKIVAPPSEVVKPEPSVQPKQEVAPTPVVPKPIAPKPEIEPAVVKNPQPPVAKPPHNLASSSPVGANKNKNKAKPLLTASGFAEDFTNSIGMKFKLIPAGEFMMGSSENESGRYDPEGPVHRVQITKPYYLGVCEVTQKQFEKVMATKPWGKMNYVMEGEDYAASYISWNDATEFCKKLSSKEGLKYRLPTEAEWEYSCRSGSKTPYSFGQDISNLDMHSWHKGNTQNVGESYAHQVGRKQPNAFGLFDMHGNVWEWCEDGFESEYYKKSPTVDPLGPASGSSRVLRGGSWRGPTRRFRSAHRGADPIGNRNSSLGFRIALVPDVIQHSQPSGNKPKRLAVPQEEAQRRITDQLMQIHDLKKRRVSTEKIELAAELFAIGRKSENPDEKYVLLDKAAQLAAQAGDPARAMAILDVLGASFEVDPLAVKIRALNACAVTVKTPQGIGNLITAADVVIDTALAAERYELAADLAARVYRACSKSHGKNFRKRALQRRKQVQELATRWQKIEEARAKLKTAPDDPPANLILGKYLCFETDDWDGGLVHLAKGSDEELKKLAHQETSSSPTDPNQQAKLGDVWWDLAETRKGQEKTALTLRAGYWYEQALPKMPAGLAKTRIEKRLTGVAAVGDDKTVSLSRLSGREQERPAKAPGTPGLIGRTTVGGKDIGLAVKYAMGKPLLKATIQEEVFRCGGELKNARITLTGILHLPQATTVLAWHAGGSSSRGIHRLDVDGRHIGSIGDDRVKDIVYRLPLKAGAYPVKWVLTGGDFGNSVLQFVDDRTKQILSVTASAKAVSVAISPPLKRILDNSSAQPRPLPPFFGKGSNGDLKGSTHIEKPLIDTPTVSKRAPLQKSRKKKKPKEEYHVCVLGIYGRHFSKKPHPIAFIGQPVSGLYTEQIRSAMLGKIDQSKITWNGKGYIYAPRDTECLIVTKGFHAAIDGMSIGISSHRKVYRMKYSLTKGLHKIKIGTGSHGGPYIDTAYFTILNSSGNQVPIINRKSDIESFLAQIIDGKPLLELSGWKISNKTRVKLPR